MSQPNCPLGGKGIFLRARIGGFRRYGDARRDAGEKIIPHAGRSSVVPDDFSEFKVPRCVVLQGLGILFRKVFQTGVKAGQFFLFE